ncbi:DUF4158 domain-containing protein [Streptomyces sp. NBC_01320]|uniref:DUF4158 domain-containing protein n=1 Tax=Streptomyces sp. NBC_01320 TaxID=2903824 RepID=UPI002E0E5FD4|nr:DUF4158 domain-containing protein [Streptomyces sp. NBC_01320]
MRQDWEPEDLIEVWTLLEDDMKRVRNKSGANRLGFTLLLKFFEVEARFPETAREIPAAAVAYGAQQMKVPAEAWAEYGWQGKAMQLACPRAAARPGCRRTRLAPRGRTAQRHRRPDPSLLADLGESTESGPDDHC